MLGDFVNHPFLRCLPPLGSERIEEVTREVGHQPIPLPLVRLWEACDGIYDEQGRWFVVWPVARLIEVSDVGYYPELPPELFPFGDDGSGAPFCVNTDTLVIEHWGPILGEREQLWSSLAEFLHALAQEGIGRSV